MSEPSKAVFLSYASQDAEAAKRIADALRSAGVEVWFDQEGGLEHGDEWDAKIRRQIKECVLFIPIISANTQARHEGYFRIEWELAAQRAMGIASGVPFILPVVVDDTREPDALVPDRFRTVQWTRLPGGAVPPEVLQRFLKLWSHRTGVLKYEATVSGGQRLESPAAPPPGGAKRPPVWRWVALAVVVAVPAYLIFRPRRSPEGNAKVTTPVQASPADATGMSAAPSEAEQLIRQARELIYDPDSARNEFGLAENLLKRATELAPTSGEAWGASALLNHYFYSRAYDKERPRLARSLAEAEKALHFSPHNTDALLALGMHRQVLGETERAKDYLEQARASDPLNPKVILAQSLQIADVVERAHFLRDTAAHVVRPAELFYYAGVNFDWAGRWAEGQAMSDRAIAAQPFWRTFVERAGNEFSSSADPTKVDAWLDRVSELKRDEPRVAFMRSGAALLRHDGAAAVRVLSALAADYLEDNFYTGPKSYLLARAYEMAGQPALALEQWQLAERVVREKLAASPSDGSMRTMLAVLLAAQHRPDEARQTAATCEADERIMGNWIARENLAEAHVRLGEPDRAIVLLSGDRSSTRTWGDVSAATLAADPQWDTLRDRPGYRPLLEQLRRAENGGAGSPSAAVTVAVDEKSVAVLAFANLSDDKGNEYFSDGISEELLNVLAKVPGLKVTARTSAFYFKGKDVPVGEIGRQLGVAYIIEGSVRKSGNQVRVTAELVKTADGFQVWSDTFTRDLKDIFAVQDEIAGLVAKNLALKLGTGATGSGTTSAEALQLYLQGRLAWNLRSNVGYDRAEGLLNRALELDPKFARAHAALADVWSMRQQQMRSGREAARLEAYEKVLAKIHEALVLDPNCAEAYASLGAVHADSWQMEESISDFRQAIRLNPNYATAHQWLGNPLAAQGYVDESLAEFRRATELDPLSPRILDNYAWALGGAGRYTEALAVLDRAQALLPKGTQIACYRATLLLNLGRKNEALAQARRLLTPELDADDPSQTRYTAMSVFMACGLKSEAEALLPQVSREGDDRILALIYLGRMPEALALLDTATPGIITYVFYGSGFGEFDSMRTDPALQRWLAKRGLVEAYARAQAWRAAHPREKPEMKQ